MNTSTICDRSNRSAQAEIFSPKDEAELIGLLKSFMADEVPVTVAAGRTSLTGGCVPDEGVVIDLMHFDEIVLPLPKTTQNQKILSPNILIKDLDDLLKKDGLVYLPTPGYKQCTLGGTVATNASGPRTFSFGATRDHVWYLRVVLIDGEVLTLNRGAYVSQGEDFSITSLGGKEYKIPCPNYDWSNIKNSTGLYAKKPLDLIDLFIGSEGVLGIVTQVGIDAKKFTAPICTKAYFFEREDEALACTEKMRAYGFDLERFKGFISIEFMDQGALKLSDFTEYSQYQAAVELEYFEDDESTIKFWNELIEGYQIGDVLENEDVPRFRYSIPFNLSEKLRHYQTVKIASDFSVPAENFKALWREYQKAMTTFEQAKVSEDVTTAIWGHIGDCHLHLNFIPQSEAQEELGQRLYLELANTCVRLGGALSAEHGVGKKKFADGRFLLRVQNPAMSDEIVRVKASLDPLFLLNPGNMVARPQGKGRMEI